MSIKHTTNCNNSHISNIYFLYSFIYYGTLEMPLLNFLSESIILAISNNNKKNPSHTALESRMGGKASLTDKWLD